MSQTREVRGVATSIRSDGEWTHVRYHATDVVSFNAHEVVLRSGGWETATTKLRMNQASHQFNLGYTVYQHKHEWFVMSIADRSVQPFRDGMTVPRIPVSWTGERWIAQA